MKHQALSLKWRPKNFSNLEGQASVRKILTNALQSKTLHPALIFSGPKGTGKTSCARILAKALCCEDKKSPEPCNQCVSCQEIQVGTNLDVNEIDGASHNGVDAIRELKESIQYMPQHGGYKIYIIDEVHMLSQSAFNSLLKTLEEPPSHVVFIMATTEFRKIPPTVISRCQLLHFRHISNDLIQKRLEVISKAEKITIDKEALWLIVEQAHGSMRDAQVLLDQMACLGNKKIHSQMIVDSLGLTRRSFLNETLQAIIEKDSKKIIDLLSNFENANPHTFLNLLLTQIRNLILIQRLQDKKSDLIFLTEEEKKFLFKLSEKISHEEAQFLFDMCLKGRQDLNLSFDARITLEMVLLRMSQFPAIEPLLLRNHSNSPPSSPKKTELSPKSSKESKIDTSNIPNQNLENPKSFQKTKEDGDCTPISESKMDFSPKEKTSLETKTSQWNQFLKYVQEKDPRMSAEIKSFSFSQSNSQKITLSYPQSLLFLKEKTTHKTFLNRLHKYLFEFFKKKMECSFVPDTKQNLYTQKKEPRKKVEKAQKDSLAKTITHLFEAVEESSPSQPEL